MSDSSQPHGLLHARLLCPILSPRVCSNSCPLSWRCYLTISSSVTLFSSCPSSFPASGSFPMSWFFASGGQSTRASASATVLPMNVQDWFPLRLTALISLLSKILSGVSSPTPQFKSISSWTLSLLYGQFSHLHVTTGKTIALTMQTFVSKVMSLLFNMLGSSQLLFQGARFF